MSMSGSRLMRPYNSLVVSMSFVLLLHLAIIFASQLASAYYSLFQW